MLKRKTSDWLINPIFIFFFLWIVQFLTHMIFSDSYDPFLDSTWIIIFMGLIAFSLGGFTSQIIAISFNSDKPEGECCVPLFIKVCIWTLLPIYMIFVASPVFFGTVLNSGIGLSEIREGLVDSTLDGDRSAIYLSYLHYFIVLACLLSLTWASQFQKITIIYIVIIGFVAGFLTFGRNILLLYFISLGIVFYFQGMINKKIASLIALLFVILFFMMAYVLGKGGVDNGLIESVIWNFKVYIISGVAAFNHYVSVGEPNVPGLLLVPNLVKPMFSIFGAELTITSGILPFVETPLPTNVYTAFYPWFHDGGVVGVFSGFYLIGLISMYFFKNRYRSRVGLFLYSLSLYPLVMTIFDEQYLRAYPLWIMVFVLWMMLSFAEKFKSNFLFSEKNK